jgi:hypothetical protein
VFADSLVEFVGDTTLCYGTCVGDDELFLLGERRAVIAGDGGDLLGFEPGLCGDADVLVPLVLGAGLGGECQDDDLTLAVGESGVVPQRPQERSHPTQDLLVVAEGTVDVELLSGL